MLLAGVGGAARSGQCCLQEWAVLLAGVGCIVVV